MSVRPPLSRRPLPRATAVVLFGVLALGLSISVSSARTGEEEGSGGASVVSADEVALSVAVRDLGAGKSSSSASNAPRINPLAGESGRGALGTRSPGAGADPLISGGQPGGRTPSPGLVFDGTSNPTACSSCVPPDTTGDVGPDHYVQMVNTTKVAIYNKSGTLLTPAFDLSTLFASGPCSIGDAGDPQVLYDEMADRWLLSQFTLTNQLCFAISQTGDPTGAYWLYSFTTPDFPDYFKVGVWPTGYYVGTNEGSYAAYVFDRTKMLAGEAATFQRFSGQTNFLMPADVDGSSAPESQGGLFYTFKDDSFSAHGGGPDRLELFQLTPDFVAPSNSTFSTVATIPITAFTYTVCGFFVFDCIPQPGGAPGLDPVSEWPMQRFAYRRFGDHEALVGNFTVDAGSDRAGIRWFELRNTGTGYSLHQEGTLAPADGLNRFMGSIAMDEAGDIALGYSVSSSSVFPSIRYSTRTPSDPPGTLQAEQTMKTGGGSQTSTSSRWGDYSAMSVDPANGCDFWFTTEYYGATSQNQWKTAIGKFRDVCGTTPPETTIDSGPANGSTIKTDSVSFGFSADESGSTFECSLDAEAFSACFSPKAYSGLADGTHSFKVRATNSFGNTNPVPTTREFMVDTTVIRAKIARVKVKGLRKVKKGKKAAYKVRIVNSGDARANGVKVKVKGRGVRAKKRVGSIRAGAARTVKVRIKPKKKGRIKVSFKVTSKNAGSKTVKRKIKVRK